MFEQAMTTEERASPPKVTKKRVCVGRDDDEVRRPGVVVITDKRTTLESEDCHDMLQKMIDPPREGRTTCSDEPTTTLRPPVACHG